MTWSVSRTATRSSINGGQPLIRSAAAAKSAASKQCAVRSRITRRGERQVSPSGSMLYGREFRNAWIFHGVDRPLSSRFSEGVSSLPLTLEGFNGIANDFRYGFRFKGRPIDADCGHITFRYASSLFILNLKIVPD